MTYNNNMGCTSSKISRRFRNRKIIEVPSLKLKKTRMSLESMSPLEPRLPDFFTIFVSNKNSIPILHIEYNSLRNRRIQNQIPRLTKAIN